MSRFLRRCLTTAIVIAFGMALIALVFGLIAVLVIAALSGPLSGFVLTTALLLVLASAFLFGAAVFVSQVVACVVADRQRRAAVQASTAGSGTQALKSEDDPTSCPLCERVPNLVLISATFGILAVLIIRHA
jgi:hypothetical protein